MITRFRTAVTRYSRRTPCRNFVKSGRGRPRGGVPRRRNIQVSTTVSGFSEIVSMPCSISHFARSEWSDGPCPQIPTYLPALRQAWIAMCSMAFTAGSRSSNCPATMPESRSSPSVSWVMSLEPIEKPSKCSQELRRPVCALEGISHIMMMRRPFLPRSRPVLFPAASITCFASSTVRTKGTMISTLVSPIWSRTFLNARHSSSKQSRKLAEM